jgi:hypothetical protein
LSNKIEDTDTRKGVAKFVDYNLIEGLLRNKNIEEAVRLAAKSDLTHAQRTRILTKAASLLPETQRPRRLALLEESLKETERIDDSTKARAYGFVRLMAEFSKSDRVRGWELLNQAITAANAVSDFTGENGMTSLTLEGKFSINLGIEMASPEDLSNGIRTLGADDFYQAVNVVKLFRGDAPRALATIAVARSVLDPKK